MFFSTMKILRETDIMRMLYNLSIRKGDAL